jgi:hypothetical protein
MLKSGVQGMEDVSRVPGQTSGLSSQHQAKKIISYKHKGISVNTFLFRSMAP